MKKILLAAALLIAGVTASQADNRERPITIDKLPAAAQEFLKSHFSGLTLAYAVEDPKLIGSEYDVTYTDRTEVRHRSSRLRSPTTSRRISRDRPSVRSNADATPGRWSCRTVWR